MNRSRRFAAVLIPGLLAVGWCSFLPSPVLGQTEQEPPAQTPQNPATPPRKSSVRTPSSVFPDKNQLSERENGPRKPDEISGKQFAEAKKWIEALGSKEFAARERAASSLMEVGTPILPQLRQIAKESPDPEVRLRAGQIIDQLTQGDMQIRIDDFLAGEDVYFEGWRVAQAILGDSNAVRELFVELIQSHPGVAASLEGTPRDRAVAMDRVVNRVQNAMFVERRFPNRADAFALLLPAVDPHVPINPAFESVLLSVLQKDAASEIRRDAQLSRPFRVLLNNWIARSTLSSRDEVLLLGMSWDIEATLPLAVQTLGEANQTETLAFALQAIARFGSRDDVEVVRPLLDDTRPASERGYARGEKVRTQLGDVAMATIASLYEVPLSEAGFERAEMHRTYGFVLSDIGFPVEDDTPREKARAKIEKLLEEAPATEGS
jgi:hypothetical protein